MPKTCHVAVSKPCRTPTVIPGAEKIVWMLFVYWVVIRHHIFWEIGHFLEFQKNGAKKVKKRKVLAKERKRKGENGFGKCLLPKKS